MIRLNCSFHITDKGTTRNNYSCQECNELKIHRNLLVTTLCSCIKYVITHLELLAVLGPVPFSPPDSELSVSLMVALETTLRLCFAERPSADSFTGFFLGLRLDLLGASPSSSLSTISVPPLQLTSTQMYIKKQGNAASNSYKYIVYAISSQVIESCTLISF